MAEGTFKLGVLKLGCIGAAPLLDLLLDERADREDLEVRAFTCGAKLDPESCTGPTNDLLAWQPQLVVLVSPNAALPGPAASRKAIAAAGLLSPIVCAVLMPLSSISVVLFACGATRWAARRAGLTDATPVPAAP